MVAQTLGRSQPSFWVLAKGAHRSDVFPSSGWLLGFTVPRVRGGDSRGSEETQVRRSSKKSLCEQGGWEPLFPP